MVKSRSRPRTHATQRTMWVDRSVDVDLVMECEEDELSPAQKSAQKKAQQQYTAFKKQLDMYKSQNAVIEYISMPLTAKEIERIESEPQVTITEHFTGGEPVVTPVETLPHFQQLAPAPASKKGGHISGFIIFSTEQRKEMKRSHKDLSFGLVSKMIGQKWKALDKKQKDAYEVLAANRQRETAKTSIAEQPSKRKNRKGSMETNPVSIDDDDDIIIVNNGEEVESESRGRRKLNKRGSSQSLIEVTPPESPAQLSPQVSTGTEVPLSLYSTDRAPIAPGLLKRFGDSMTEVAPPAKKKPIANSNKKDESSMIQVPLDEYYYSKKEGDPAYREEKGEFRFKCWYCHKMLYNNLRIMMHMQGHIDLEKQQNLDLSDLTQCKQCFKQFDTPFEMQCHVEKVHQNKSKVLVCRICEKDHENQAALRQHMKAVHLACEMPYICQLCNFRSSVYSDVVDHFKKRHDSSQYIMCLYCLKIFKVNFSKASGWGFTQNFYQHIQKHQANSHNKKCPCCKLTFINKLDIKVHRQRDHLPNFRGAISGNGVTSNEAAPTTDQVMIKLPSTSDGKAGKLKSLNAPTVAKVQEISGVRFNWITDTHMCKECWAPMNSLNHFKKYVECSLCRYATTCSNAYAYHMMGFHSGNRGTRHLSIPVEKALADRWFCLCGYSSSKGNSMANHLVRCSKRTSYIHPPEQKFFEYDDEQEEFNPFEPYTNDEVEEMTEKSTLEKEIPSLFGALGLVRKQDHPGITKRETPCSSPELSSGDVATRILDDVLDHVFPAETEASRAVGSVMKKVNKRIVVKEKKAAKVEKAVDPSSEDIPPELTGAQKWSTVKIPDSRLPTKASVFLGSEDMKDGKSKKLEEENLAESNQVEAMETSQSEVMETSQSEAMETSKLDDGETEQQEPMAKAESPSETNVESNVTEATEMENPDKTKIYESTETQAAILATSQPEAMETNVCDEQGQFTETSGKSSMDWIQEYQSKAVEAHQEASEPSDKEAGDLQEVSPGESQKPVVTETDDLSSMGDECSPILDEVNLMSEGDVEESPRQKQTATEEPSQADHGETNEHSQAAHEEMEERSQEAHEEIDEGSQKAHEEIEEPSQADHGETDEHNQAAHEEPEQPSQEAHEDSEERSQESHEQKDEISQEAHEEVEERSQEGDEEPDKMGGSDLEDDGDDRVIGQGVDVAEKLESDVDQSEQAAPEEGTVGGNEQENVSENPQESEDKAKEGDVISKEDKTGEDVGRDKGSVKREERAREEKESSRRERGSDRGDQQQRSRDRTTNQISASGDSRPSGRHDDTHRRRDSHSHDRSHSRSSSQDYRRDEHRRNDQRHGGNYRRDDSRSHGSYHDNRNQGNWNRSQGGGYDNRNNWQGGHNRDNRYGGNSGHQNQRDDRYGNNQRGGYRNDNYRGGYNNRGRGGYQGGNYRGGYY